MRFKQTIRFARLLRTIRLGDPTAVEIAAQQAEAESNARALAESTAQERERQERSGIEETLAALEEAAQSLTRWHNQLLNEMQQVAVELATAITTRVTYDKLETDRFAIEQLAHDVVSHLGTNGPVQVRMHPDDLALLNRRLGDGRMAEYHNIQLVPDETLGRGDCIADAGDVSFASTLEEQLNGMRQHLLRNLTDAQIERRKAQAGDRELRRFPDRRQTA